MKRVTHLAHDLIDAILHPGDIAVDATAGNGHDTLFLAGLVGDKGHVHAFDIQEAALTSTRQRLASEACQTPVSYHLCSHALLAKKVTSASAITFNLGYLPGTDQKTITEAGSTLQALAASLEILTPGGILTCICYPGHPGGLEEAEAALAWAEKQTHQDAHFDLITANQKDRLEGRPFLVALKKAKRV
ncbi:methyltransferase domain-containing protein [Akkermansiaceae bacterium]|nr:methyltransferase domain-containing protein [Akkermansiaceae bacterium]